MSPHQIIIVQHHLQTGGALSVTTSIQPRVSTIPPDIQRILIVVITSRVVISLFAVKCHSQDLTCFCLFPGRRVCGITHLL